MVIPILQRRKLRTEKFIICPKLHKPHLPWSRTHPPETILTININSLGPQAPDGEGKPGLASWPHRCWVTLDSYSTSVSS